MRRSRKPRHRAEKQRWFFPVREVLLIMYATPWFWLEWNLLDIYIKPIIPII